MDECEEGVGEVMENLRKEHLRWVLSESVSSQTIQSMNFRFPQESCNVVVFFLYIVNLIALHKHSSNSFSRSKLLKVLPILVMIIVAASVLVATVVLEQVSVDKSRWPPRKLNETFYALISRKLFPHNVLVTTNITRRPNSKDPEPKSLFAPQQIDLA